MPYPLGTVVDTIFQFADRNRNGKIDTAAAPGMAMLPKQGPDETKLGMKDRLMLSTAAKVKRFDVPAGDLGRFVPLIDADKDGALTKPEARAFIKRFDTNNDNALDDNEIRAGLRRAAAGTL